MRTSYAIDDIIANATINYCSKAQQISYLSQSMDVDTELLERAYNHQNKINNVLYALNPQFSLSSQYRSLLCDFLIRNGYYQQNSNVYFTEIVFNDQDFDTY